MKSLAKEQRHKHLSEELLAIILRFLDIRKTAWDCCIEANNYREKTPICRPRWNL